MDSSHIDSIEVVEDIQTEDHAQSLDDSEPTSSLITMSRFKKMVSHCLTLYFV